MGPCTCSSRSAIALCQDHRLRARGREAGGARGHTTAMPISAYTHLRDSSAHTASSRWSTDPRECSSEAEGLARSHNSRQRVTHRLGISPEVTVPQRLTWLISLTSEGCRCHKTVQIIPIKYSNQPFKLNHQLLHSTSMPKLPAVTRINYTGTLAKRRA